MFEARHAAAGDPGHIRVRLVDQRYGSAIGPASWAEAFGRPAQVNQRRYEAIRAYLHEGASLDEPAARFGYTRSALASLVRDFRAGKLVLFAEPGRPGALADDPTGILRRRAVFHRQPQRRSRRGPPRPGTGPPAAFRPRLPGDYAPATPDTLQRRFLDSSGTIISNADTESPSRSTAAPTHRSSATPPSPPTPPSPGGTAVASTSSSANNEAQHKLRGNPR